MQTFVAPLLIQMILHVFTLLVLTTLSGSSFQ